MCGGRSAGVHRAERRPSLLTDRACSNRFFNLLLNSGHIETGTALHRREVDERLRRLRYLLLDEHEAPELVGEPVVIGDLATALAVEHAKALIGIEAQIGQDRPVDFDSCAQPTIHALRAQFTRILYFLLSYFAPARLHGWIVYICRPCVEHIARSNSGFERWWIVAMTGVLHCIEVIEIPEELIEAVQRRQELIEVAQMVLAELAGGVTHGFQHGGNSRRGIRHADRRASLTDSSQSSADREFAGDEVRTTRRAARFGIIIGTSDRLRRQPIEVGGSTSNYSWIVDADVCPADVVPHDEDNVGPLLLLRGSRHARRRHGDTDGNQSSQQELAKAHG